MKISLIAYKNLLRKKTRTALTVLGIALSAWVLASLLGFNRGYELALNRDIDNMGFQVLLTAKGCPYEAATLMLKGGTALRYLKESMVAGVSRNPEVEEVTPMLMQAVFDPNKGESGGMSAFLGVDPANFPRLKGFLEFKQGGWFKDPRALETVMGYEAAELEQREVGDSYLLPEQDLEVKVVGILKRTGTQDDGTVFLPVRTVQKAFKKQGLITGLGIKVKKGADVDKLTERLYDLPDVQVVSMAQVKHTIKSLLASAKVMVFSIAIIAILIAMVGVINTILMSVFERFQELGILKSMGAMPKDVFQLIWTETLILCLLGSVLGVSFGLALSHATEALVRRLLPYAPTGGLIQIDWGLALGTVAAVTAAGLLSGLYPAWRAARVRPLDAIRSEAE